MPHLNDGTARSLQDMGVDLDKLAAWEQTDEGKAATQRFAEMCERGEIISRPAWATAEIPVQIAEAPVLNEGKTAVKGTNP